MRTIYIIEENIEKLPASSGSVQQVEFRADEHKVSFYYIEENFESPALFTQRFAEGRPHVQG